MANSNDEHWKVITNRSVVVSNTAEELWDNACKYFAWCDMNPIKNKVTAMSGKEFGRVVETEQRRLYSIKALCMHCGVLEEYLRDLRKLKDQNSDWYRTVTAIYYIIYTQNLENAAVEVFNPIFVSKILGMEKEEVPTGAITVKVINALTDGSPIPTLSNSENEILEKLEVEILEKQKSKEQKSNRDLGS